MATAPPIACSSVTPTTKNARVIIAAHDARSSLTTSLRLNRVSTMSDVPKRSIMRNVWLRGLQRTSDGVCPGPAARDADVVELRPQTRHHRDSRRTGGIELSILAPQVRDNDQGQGTAIDLRHHRQLHTQSRWHAALLVQTLRWNCQFHLSKHVGAAAIASAGKRSEYIIRGLQWQLLKCAGIGGDRRGCAATAECGTVRQTAATSSWPPIQIPLGAQVRQQAHYAQQCAAPITPTDGR